MDFVNKTTAGRRWLLWQLPLLVLLLFVLDKTLLHERFRFAVTDTLPGNPYMETLFDLDSPWFDLELPEHKESVVWNFGTSRSLPLYRMPDDTQTRIDPFIDDEERERMLRYELFNFAAAGSNPSLYYVRLMQLIERGYEPDALTIEVTATAFNRSSRFTASTMFEGIPLGFALRHARTMPNEYLYEIIMSRLFLANRYRISFASIRSSLTGGARKDPELLQLFQADDLSNMAARRPGRPLGDGEVDDQAAGADMPPVLWMMRYEMLTEIGELEFFSNWQTDENQFHFLEALLDVAAERQIPVILWRPPVHPHFARLYDKYEVDQRVISRLNSYGEREGVRYLDLQVDVPLECQYYVDASHLSTRCYTELTARLLGALP